MTMQTLELVSDQRLLIERKEREDILHLMGSDGRLRLSVVVTPAGPVLKFDGAGLLIQTTGALAIDAESVEIRGREGVTLKSGGGARIEVAGDLDLNAGTQTIRATLGNVNVRANDDVRIDGERVLMNC